MDYNDGRKKRNSKARERHSKRQNRQETMVTLRETGLARIPRPQKNLPEPVQHALSVAQDFLWHMFHRTPGNFIRIAAGLVGIIVLFFFLSLIFSSNIGPNISVLETGIGGMSVEAASERLLQVWNEDISLSVMLDGEPIAQVRPSEVGLHIDSAATAQLGKDAGLAGLPFGHSIEPLIEVDYSELQSYMLALSDEIYTPPYEAGYEWRDGRLYGVAGRASRELDIPVSLQRIVDQPTLVIEERRVELFTTSTAPTVSDPEPYLSQAINFVTSDFTVTGYDPFLNEFQYWQTTREQMASWLVAGSNGLEIRAEGLDAFVQTVNGMLNVPENPRYLDENDAVGKIAQAFASGETSVNVRIRYLPRQYIVERGDTGFSIGRKIGLPFANIDVANPGLDWNTLVVGQEINLPSLDLVLPTDPMPGKRIVVDLERMWLVAYENEQVIFNWPISIGRDDAPTSPGIYQILEKIDIAYGSSFSLCGDNGCGQWEMDYFMGIYEIAPGLTNGFHGAVRLPNGGYLDGGSQQVRSTFGCVMSDNVQAQQLYEWAVIGTVVEIVSDDFQPRSALARQAITFMDSLGS